LPYVKPTVNEEKTNAVENLYSEKQERLVEKL